jgi:vanillate O-demethylase monooxygenase subunit
MRNRCDILTPLEFNRDERGAMTKPFLKNAWYCAAWASEVTGELFHRVIIGEDVLMFRDAQGTALAFSNFCPHRSAPLHMGRLVSGRIQCPYHGLQFGPDGRCVHNPHHRDGLAPDAARLRRYPLVEKDALLWVWMGDPQRADPATIPDFSCHTNPAMAMVSGTLSIDAWYELITDNLLDLTHVEFVHAGILGSSAVSRGTHEVVQDGTTVWSNRWCPDGEAPPALAHAFNDYRDPVDYWLYMRWDPPASMLLDVGITPVGATRRDGWWVYGTDILTPADRTTTHYFWGITYEHGVKDPEVAAAHRKAVQLAFVQQDKPMIEAQQRALRLRGGMDIADVESAWLDSDAAPTRARLVLKKLLRAGDDAAPQTRNHCLTRLRQTAPAKDARARIAALV